jgi:hypothetical protein
MDLAGIEDDTALIWIGIAKCVFVAAFPSKSVDACGSKSSTAHHILTAKIANFPTSSAHPNIA